MYILKETLQLAMCIMLNSRRRGWKLVLCGFLASAHFINHQAISYEYV